MDLESRLALDEDEPAVLAFVGENGGGLFAEAVGGAVGSARAWPSIPGYQPPSRICKPFTAEGFAAHAEWVWPTTGNGFLWVVTVLQDDLDTKYAGRAA